MIRGLLIWTSGLAIIRRQELSATVDDRRAKARACSVDMREEVNAAS
jgi:hypothetical protein